MNTDDTLYGRIKNGVLTISGNNSSIRVDGGFLVVSDGPTAVPANHQGAAAPLEQRMVTQRFRRADCPIERIIVTRPGGFITFAALKWLHGVGVGLMQLDWDGTVLLSTAPRGLDQPAMRRAQALASDDERGFALTREILGVKIKGQAGVAKLLGGDEAAALIMRFVEQLDAAKDIAQLLHVEAMAAVAYWPLWQPVPLRFARRERVPEHWQAFGFRKSPISGKPLRAATAGNAILNYLYGVLAGEMTIALTGVGLDPGIGIFHKDTHARASLSYDAVEPLRPYVDAWLLDWLGTARLSKRDFYEEANGTVRLTRPLTSHLAMTAAIWRPAAQAVADWLARSFAEKSDAKHRLLSPLPALPAPRRSWKGLEPPIVKTCAECGKALAPRQRKFCSEACTVAFHLSTTIVLPARGGADRGLGVGEIGHGGTAAKNRRHLALRRAWDAEHTPGEGLSHASALCGENKMSGPSRELLRQWFADNLVPLLSGRRTSDVQQATGLSVRYAISIRHGQMPHPRHFAKLAALCGVAVPVGIVGNGL